MARRRSTPWYQRWSRPILAGLATIGVLDTAYLAAEKLGWIGPVVCPTNGCTDVLNSPWATIPGINLPLPFAGLASYLTMLVLAVLPLCVSDENRKSLRRSLEKNTWLLIFILATAMVSFSAYLMFVMAVQIKAVCAFCILSATLATLMFVLSLVGHEWEDVGQLFFSGLITALVVIFTALGVYANVNNPALADRAVPGQTGDPVTTQSSPAAIALAKHLKASGAKLYTAWWCPHCHDQKQLFGKPAVKELPLIECDPQGQNPQVEACKAADLQGFPTWVINGEKFSGTRPLKLLAEKSGYKGDMNF
jgi:uncharacterized membrane protein